MASKRPCPSPDDDVLRKMTGQDEGGQIYECSKYIWTDKRAHCYSEPDRKFAAKRLALLYIAKQNCASLQTYLQSSGKKWSDVCKDEGCYAVKPNKPFDFPAFLELSDEELFEYGREVGNVLNVQKAPEGVIYRFATVEIKTTSASDLYRFLNEA
mmetsp:Transcript_95458/g.208752  ORF Transcript_95458/g.208752 Transcript_95458/m.208752 type:complete len:155 (+) Transcript_95458:63-527(+)